MDAIVEAITAFAEWLLGLVTDFVEALLDLIKDAFIWALDGVLSAIVAIFAAIPAPEFLTAYSLGNILSGVHPMIGYYASGLNIGLGMSLLASGFAFRMLRKALTLFQW